IAATNDRQLNEKIVQSCAPYQLTLNVSDHTASNTMMAAMIKTEQIQVAVSTNGKHPIQSKKVRDDIRTCLKEAEEACQNQRKKKVSNTMMAGMKITEQIQVAVSTNGKQPILAKKVRDDIRTFLKEGE